LEFHGIHRCSDRPPSNPHQILKVSRINLPHYPDLRSLRPSSRSNRSPGVIF
jgi:hypothetical protein